jgi:hypothetical protein
MEKYILIYPRHDIGSNSMFCWLPQHMFGVWYFKSSLPESISLALCRWRRKKWHTFFTMYIESSKCRMGNFFQYLRCEFKVDNLFILGVCKLSAIVTHKFIHCMLCISNKVAFFPLCCQKYILKEIQNGWFDGNFRL